MKNWLKKHGIEISISSVIIAIAILQDLLGFSERYGLKPETSMWIGGGLIAAVIIFILARYARAVWNAIKRISRNVHLLLLGQEDLHKRIKQLQRAYSAGPFVKFAGLTDYQGPYHIFFSHKEDQGKHPVEDRAAQYQIPPPPFDEAEPVMRVWHPIAQHLNGEVEDVRPHCTCAWKEKNDAAQHPKRVAYRNELLTHPHTIIGSPKHNYVCRELMLVLEKKKFDSKRPPLLKLDTTNPEDTICYIVDVNSGDEYRPLTTANAKNGARLRDYALLMRLPNVLGNPGKGTVLVLAGCKRAGQVALTRWLGDPQNLIDLETKFPGQACCIAFEVNYEFQSDGNPEIDEDPITLPDFPRLITLK